MKKAGKLFLGIMGLAIVLAACNQSGNKTDAHDHSSHEHDPATELSSFTPDLEKSKVFWAGTSLGVYTHTGTVDFKEANVAVLDGKVTGGSFVADLTTMVATDENFNPDEGYSKEKLIGHLSSADFFDVENYPDAKFVINSVEGNSATGTLTVRGISNTETVSDIAVTEIEGETALTGKLVFDRKKYDVKWDYPVKDKVLKKEIELNIHLIGS